MSKSLASRWFSPDEFQRVLDVFSDCVINQHRYRKMDYGTWKQLSKAKNLEHVFSAELIPFSTTSENPATAYEIHFPAEVTTSAFKATDNSFGQFLFDTYFKERIETMIKNNELNDEIWYKYSDEKQNIEKHDNLFDVLKKEKNYGKWTDYTATPDHCDRYGYPLNDWEFIDFNDTNTGLGVSDTKTADTAIASLTVDSCASTAKATIDSCKINTGSALTYDSAGYISDFTGTAISIDTGSLVSKSEVDSIKSALDELRNKITNNEKENEKMKGFNFDFGPCTDNAIRMSMYGLAVKNSVGVWVSYDKNTNAIVDVDILNFDAGKYFFKMPVALNAVEVGDVIIHNRKPMFVVENSPSLICVDVCAGEEKTVIPTTNMFGFNFITKVVSLFENVLGTPSADSPFGNMLPLLMLGGDNGKDIDPMMLMLMMNQTGATGNMNPMMLYFMMKDNKDMDPLMLMMLMGNGGFPGMTTPTGRHQAIEVETPVFNPEGCNSAAPGVDVKTGKTVAPTI